MTIAGTLLKPASSVGSWDIMEVVCGHFISHIFALLIVENLLTSSLSQIKFVR